MQAPCTFCDFNCVLIPHMHMVQAAVEMSRKYRHVAWYSLFVAAYMVVLYLQVRTLLCFVFACACVGVEAVHSKGPCGLQFRAHRAAAGAITQPV